MNPRFIPHAGNTFSPLKDDGDMCGMHRLSLLELLSKVCTLKLFQLGSSQIGYILWWIIIDCGDSKSSTLIKNDVWPHICT